MPTALSQGARSVALWAGCVFPLRLPSLPGPLACRALARSLKSRPAPTNAPVALPFLSTSTRPPPPPLSASGPAFLCPQGPALGVLWSQGRDWAQGRDRGHRAIPSLVLPAGTGEGI